MADLQATSVNGVLTSLRTENVKTSAHSLVLADRDKVVAFTGGGAQTCTIPTDATQNFPIGSVVYIGRYGSGSVTITGAGGVSLSRAGSFSPNEEIMVRKRAANSWILIDSPKDLSGDGGSVSNASGYTIHTFTSNGTFTAG